MTKLIIYVNSEQNASAYRIEEDNSYSISFNGNEYESDLLAFAEIVMEELRATPLSKMESRGGIAVLIVSNEATNETIRKIMELLFHDDNEDGLLNVNIHELNVIEAKYFLSLIGNSESPSAKDFAQFFEIEKKSMVNAQALEELKSKLTKLQGELDNKNSEISELQKFRESVIKEREKEIKKQTIKAKDEIKKKIDNSNRICKINFRMDCKETKRIDSVPDVKGDIKFNFLKYSEKGTKIEEGTMIEKDTCIGLYAIASLPASFTSGFLNSVSLALRNLPPINKNAKRSGKLFYVVNDMDVVEEGDVVAVIGDEDWTTKDVVECLKRNSYNIPYVNKYENNPLIYDSETH